MIRKDNPWARVQGQPEALFSQDGFKVDPKNDARDGRKGAAGDPKAQAKTEKKSLDVIFDLEDPEEAASLERHEAAFGHDHSELEPLGDEKVVLRLYPGGAGRLP